MLGTQAGRRPDGAPCGRSPPARGTTASLGPQAAAAGPIVMRVYDKPPAPSALVKEHAAGLRVGPPKPAAGRAAPEHQ